MSFVSTSGQSLRRNLLTISLRRVDVLACGMMPLSKYLSTIMCKKRLSLSVTLVESTFVLFTRLGLVVNIVINSHLF